MNQSEIDRIKTYCEKATNGPWKFWGGTRTYAINGHRRNRIIECDCEDKNPAGFEKTGGIVEFADADFIASARTDLPAAIAEIERLRDLLNKAHAELTHANSNPGTRAEVAAMLEDYLR